MLWTADSVDITADGICWTADGYNGCTGFAGEEYSEEELIISAHYKALKLAIYEYYGIKDETL